jgi:hypothetical protein
LFATRRTDINGAESINQVGASFVAPLQRELSVLQKEDPAQFAKFILAGNIDSLFVINGHRKTMKGYIVDLDISEEGRVIAHSVAVCPNGAERCTMVSSKVGLVSFFRTKPNLPTSNEEEITTTVHRIMGAAMSARPNEVGPPIDILAIEPAELDGWNDKAVTTLRIRHRLPPT